MPAAMPATTNWPPPGWTFSSNLGWLPPDTPWSGAPYRQPGPQIPLFLPRSQEAELARLQAWTAACSAANNPAPNPDLEPDP